MAPVKRSTTTAQRETRATRAATVAKKKATTAEKKTSVTAPSKPVSTTTKPTASTRQSKKSIEEQPEQLHLQDIQEKSEHDKEVTKPTRARATRATVIPTGLAAAPRRRVKITPLDPSQAEASASTRTTSETKHKKKDAPVKKASTRSKTATTEDTEVDQGQATATEPKTKTTRKTAAAAATTTTEKAKIEKLSAPRTRGRPKSQRPEEPEQLAAAEVESVITTRATRANRAASIALSEAVTSITESKFSKPQDAIRKKVTFQDLPSENDKENQPLPVTRGKRTAAKKDSEDAKATTGLRAKPLRRAVASTTRGRKATVAVSRSSSKGSAQDNNDKEVKRMPRALTPKKITQIAKSSSPEHGTDISEGEDELNGGKTPIRDLSVSPRRPTNAALAKALSPVKKLDFGQSLLPKSPDRTTVFRDMNAEQSGVLASPARRPAASPFKDGLRDSPKRGLQDGTRLLFPIQNERLDSVALSSSTLGSSQALSTILQSPKRTGILDPNFFSQSAMKKSAKKSPFKSSLLGSPAKRLFSPAKQSITPSLPEAVTADLGSEATDDQEEMEIESEITASSHFKSSSSPLRVMRVEPDPAAVDFDDSVLQFRSPLKVQKSPNKVLLQPDFDVATNTEMPTPKDSAITTGLDVQIIDPSTLDRAERDQSEGSQSPTVDNIDHTVEHDESDISENREEAVSVGGDSTRRPSLSQILFRSASGASEEESSEDELARDKTPIRQQARDRSSLTGAQSRSRMSVGVPSSAAGKGFGFTPLAAQMSGWLASSPEKSFAERQTTRHPSTEFSPLAQQHIDGEILISRDSTPVQRLDKRISMQPISSAKLTASARRPADLRRSMAQRQSMGLFTSMESPARDREFEEYMEIRAIEEQAEAEARSAPDRFEVDADEEDFDQIMDIDGHLDDVEAGDDTIVDSANGDHEDHVPKSAGDLTTDLVNFTHASDTAMVDFQKLAEEAEQLASDKFDDDNKEVYELELEPEIETPSPATSDTTNDAILSASISHEARSPLLQPVESSLDSPSVLVIDQADSPAASVSPPSSISQKSPSQRMSLDTPQPNLRINERRIINTVVSKVPLKPEGSISPIKMPRKRSRSFGNNDASPAKRASFENLRNLQSSNVTEIVQSPDRRIRTSVAPSPGGTSTPATARSNVSYGGRFSLGCTSTMSTPGSISFAADDFGDSTLDGIELPEDFYNSTEFSETESPARSVRSAGRVSTTPKAALVATPTTSRRSVRRATTPATITRATPKKTQKTPSRASANTNDERTPLGPVGTGVLHGATVFVDVHTSEGADASGIFVELLTQMGAKCVKDWRWNPRASLAPETNESSEPKVGITHVVYKDGGKRTLEKVRDAKGEVCCVGVAWVLDCERENKWLDESTYAIDTNIIPRGGSKRRKSMEPRALLVANDGSVSASRARRSVSGEMNQRAKRELINTPVRGQSPSLNDEAEHDDDDDDDGENDENVEQSTPTGFVSYDPRTAMTPGTPYLISQGRKLTQMSAPPKQHNKSLFDDDENEENDDTFVERGNGDVSAVKDAKKFRMKNLGDIAKRRRTLGWKPAVGSPLSRA